jgi:glycosyltransferase involved in cell wall biosynthesis
MIVSSHPMGNANVRQAMQAFAEAGLLKKFLTAIAIFDGTPWGWLSKQPGFGELRRRHFPDVLHAFTECHPLREVSRLLAMRLGGAEWIRNEQSCLSVDQIFQSIDRKLAKIILKGKTQAVYSYEDGALDSFRAAKKMGVKCLYDHPVAHWRTVRSIMSEEAQLQPDWLETLPGFKDSLEKLERKDLELQHADRIYVASEFSRSSLSGCPFPIAPIVVNSYGAPYRASMSSRLPAQKKPNDPLKILFVGGLHQMKGISYLLEAKKQLGSMVSLTLIGALLTNKCRALNLGLSSNRWISGMPHDEILAQMREHDLFVFPSLCEGFGMVITEALSQGLPVITTPHTCGPDVISDGVDGFIVPIRNPQAIVEKVELLYRNRDRLEEMSLAALQKASQLTWGAYRSRLVADVNATLLSST